MRIRRNCLRLCALILVAGLSGWFLTRRVPASAIVSRTFGNCPLCYGDDFCTQLPGLSIGFHRTLLNYRNVYFASDSYRTVVLKKLASERELTSVHQQLVGLSGLPVNSRPSDVGITLNSKFLAGDLTIESVLDRRPDKDAPNAIASCHAFDLIDRQLFSSVSLSLIAITNPEPLVLSRFPRESGWPFPRYLGSCGLFVAVEYAGPDLESLLAENWNKRAEWSIQLLEIGKLLSNKSATHAIYMTDLELRNFAVDPATDRVLVVDAEHVVVVPRRTSATSESVSGFHAAEHVPCGRSCLSFSVPDLCSHPYSDHNVYAVCRVFETTRLLLPVPDTVSEDERRVVEGLVEDCVSGGGGKPRTELADMIVAKLRNILRSVRG